MSLDFDPGQSLANARRMACLNGLVAVRNVTRFREGLSLALGMELSVLDQWVLDLSADKVSKKRARVE